MALTARPVSSRPWGSFLALLMALLYGASPIDLIPDLIPLLGWSDDAAVGLALGLVALKLFLRWRERRRPGLVKISPNGP